jgi:hypothetical protein
LRSAPLTEDDRAGPANGVSPCPTAARTQFATFQKKTRRRRLRSHHSLECADYRVPYTYL